MGIWLCFPMRGTRVVFEGQVYENRWYASDSNVPNKSMVWDFVGVCASNANQAKSTASNKPALTNSNLGVNSISVYPTQVKDIVNIETKFNGILKLVNISGIVDSEKKVSSGLNTLSMNTLPNGFHIILINTEDGNTRNVKLVKY
ncbi:hypothetical protein [uncultured Winogradskyella sp.]|uniref:hypothetical protein n=1 Tax=uncultured Winogradskyella sp. TaxID=395353 RepID=UPI002610A42F|nr:hypothetical protein [uncultured Winogradskyella sp.]